MRVATLLVADTTQCQTQRGESDSDGDDDGDDGHSLLFVCPLLPLPDSLPPCLVPRQTYRCSDRDPLRRGRCPLQSFGSEKNFDNISAAVALSSYIVK